VLIFSIDISSGLNLACAWSHRLFEVWLVNDWFNVDLVDDAKRFLAALSQYNLNQLCRLFAAAEMFVCDKVYDELFPTFEHFSNKPCQYKMRAAWTHPNSKLSKTSLKLDAFVCYVLAFKRMKFETNSVLNLLGCCLLSWIPIKPWMWINSGYQLPSIFSKREVWNFFLGGKFCSLLMVNAEKWGAKIKKWERCQLAIA